MSYIILEVSQSICLFRISAVFILPYRKRKQLQPSFPILLIFVKSRDGMVPEPSFSHGEMLINIVFIKPVPEFINNIIVPCLFHDKTSQKKLFQHFDQLHPIHFHQQLQLLQLRMLHKNRQSVQYLSLLFGKLFQP